MSKSANTRSSNSRASAEPIGVDMIANTCTKRGGVGCFIWEGSFSHLQKQGGVVSGKECLSHLLLALLIA